MKLLHCTAQKPEVTGSGVYYRQLVQGLASKGHDNALLFAEQDQDDFSWTDSYLQYPVYFKTDELPFAMPGMSDEMPYESTVYSELTPVDFARWQLAFIQSLSQAKADFQPDVVISHHIFALSFLVAQVFQDTPIIGICHGTDLWQLEMHPQLKKYYVTAGDELDYYFTLGPEDAHKLTDCFGLDPDRVLATGGGFNSEIFILTCKKKISTITDLFLRGKSHILKESMNWLVLSPLL